MYWLNLGCICILCPCRKQIVIVGYVKLSIFTGKKINIKKSKNSGLTAGIFLKRLTTKTQAVLCPINVLLLDRIERLDNNTEIYQIIWERVENTVEKMCWLQQRVTKKCVLWQNIKNHRLFVNDILYCQAISLNHYLDPLSLSYKFSFYRGV